MAPTTNSLDFDCQWRFGYNLQARGKGTVGYLLFWSGCGGLNLPKDTEVWNPFSDQGQTVVQGETIKCIGLMESFRFEGGADDPIRMSVYVSKDVAANIRTKLASPLPSTKLKVQWYIISYDDDDPKTPKWYEAASIKGGGRADAAIDSTKGQVQMFIANEPTFVSETLDLRVYRFEFQIVPAAGSTTTLEFATGASQRLVKSWGGA